VNHFLDRNPCLARARVVSAIPVSCIRSSFDGKASLLESLCRTTASQTFNSLPVSSCRRSRKLTGIILNGAIDFFITVLFCLLFSSAGETLVVATLGTGGTVRLEKASPHAYLFRDHQLPNTGNRQIYITHMTLFHSDPVSSAEDG